MHIRNMYKTHSTSALREQRDKSPQDCLSYSFVYAQGDNPVVQNSIRLLRMTWWVGL